MVASAAWSKRLPSTEDRWLESRAEHGIRPSTFFVPTSRSKRLASHPRVMQASLTT